MSKMSELDAGIKEAFIEFLRDSEVYDLEEGNEPVWVANSDLKLEKLAKALGFESMAAAMLEADNHTDES